MPCSDLSTLTNDDDDDDVDSNDDHRLYSAHHIQLSTLINVAMMTIGYNKYLQYSLNDTPLSLALIIIWLSATIKVAPSMMKDPPRIV